MTRLAALLYQFRSRGGLIAIAVLLLALNVGRLTVDYLNTRQEMLANRLTLLQQQRRLAAGIEALRARVTALEARKKEVESFLFHGESIETVASAMQIALQGTVAKSGLTPESVRPIMRGRGKEAKEERQYRELAVKLRLAGDLAGLLDFIAELYRSKRLFVIESLVVKPTRKELKVLMDLKGFYVLTNGGEGGEG